MSPEATLQVVIGQLFSQPWPDAGERDESVYLGGGVPAGGGG